MKYNRRNRNRILILMQSIFRRTDFFLSEVVLPSLLSNFRARYQKLLWVASYGEREGSLVGLGNHPLSCCSLASQCQQRDHEQMDFLPKISTLSLFLFAN